MAAIFQVPLITRSDDALNWPSEPVRSVLVIGHGALAERQRPLYQHWLGSEVQVHCADSIPARLEDCLDGIKRYVVPKHEANLLSNLRAGVDLLCVNNPPHLHLISAMQYSMLARNIVIQKPQDLNFSLITTIETDDSLSAFRTKTRIHDHYRNKSVTAALQRALPGLLRERGPIRRALFVLTEPKSVTDEDELARAESLKCGMIGDLATHMLDQLLGVLNAGLRWQSDSADNRFHCVTRCSGEVVKCHKRRELHSSLGDDVETFAAIDVRMEQMIEFPEGSGRAHCHPLDVLIIVGKGIAVEDNLPPAPLKFIAIEFELGRGYEAWIDYSTLTTHGFETHLPRDKNINRNHGGLNRPFFLIGPDPPDHARHGFGGEGEEQWQTLSVGSQVAQIAQQASALSTGPYMQTYRAGRALADLLRELVSRGAVRSSWATLDPFTKYMTDVMLPSEYYD